MLRVFLIYQMARLEQLQFMEVLADLLRLLKALGMDGIGVQLVALLQLQILILLNFQLQAVQFTFGEHN